MDLSIKKFMKYHLPPSILRLIRLRKDKEYNTLSPEQIFTKIYERNLWGNPVNANDQFYSGSGSHREEELSVYIAAVGEFFGSFDVKPNVVDLGCGDFAVGSQIRKFCNNYVACDVVPGLIDFNKNRFNNLAVDFMALNIVDDPLPPGDVAIVRQVLQHLSNLQVNHFISRARSTYRYIIVSEHLPGKPGFEHNVDKITGPGTRMGYDSGIVLTSPPFNLRPAFERQLCCVKSVDPGIILTTLYGM